MKMRACGPACGAHAAHDGPGRDMVTLGHGDHREVPISRGQSVLVLDLDHIPISATPSGGDDLSASGRPHGRARLLLDVRARMERHASHEGIHAQPKAGGDFQSSCEWAAQRQRRDDLGQAAGCCVVGGDPAELLLEQRAVRVGLERDVGSAQGFAPWRGEVFRREAGFRDDIFQTADTAPCGGADLGEGLDLVTLHLLKLKGYGAEALGGGGLLVGGRATPRAIGSIQAGAQLKAFGRRLFDDFGAGLFDRRGASFQGRGSGLLAQGLDRGGRLRIDAHLLRQRRDHGRAGFQPGLACEQFMHPALQGVMVEQLPAGHPVDLRAHGGQTVLVVHLHGPMAAQQRHHHVIAKDVPAQRRRARGQSQERDEKDQPNGHGAKAQGADAPVPTDGERDAGGGKLPLVALGKWHERENSANGHAQAGRIWLIFREFDRSSSHFSARAAARTSSAWPGTFTLFQTCATLPSAPISRVVRSTPMYLRPYMLFSTQTP